MPYSIDRYNGTTITVVEDGTIDSSLDIKLIGKNYAGYGEVQNENFVHLLENFSGTSAPPRPISGQVWYDSSSKKLKFYDNSKWRTTGGAEVSVTAPTGLTIGDFWFDNANNQLYAWTGTEYVLVGPQGVAGSGTTQMRSRSVRDTSGSSHAIIEALVDGEAIYIISPDEFTLDNSVNAITGFSKIKQGLTLTYTGDTGVTSTSHRYWGTASNALKLEGLGASDFISSTSPSFTGVVRFADDGYTVGDDNDLAVFINSGTDPVIRNAISNTITFQTTVSSTVKTPMKLVGDDILPGTDGISNIGSSTYKYATIYAGSFNGTATQADTLNVGGTYRSASATAGVNTIAARDSSGDLYANLFQGTATSARYADLAEKYLTDAEYEVGTVVSVGGDREVTACKFGDRALGAVSANPAFMMNKDQDGGTYIALKGRVPVKVVGSVKKGDRLVASQNGTAVAATFHQHPDVFAIALETNADTGVKLVESVIL
jgi:hypothetical protein